MGSNENTKLCDFTSHNNSDFICTPIAPPATSAPSYENKPIPRSNPNIKVSKQDSS